MPDTPDNLPGSGFFGWLGRQIGHVTKAVKTNVAGPEQPAAKVLYRDCTVEEKPLPTDPNVKLRRTVIDEVVEEKTLNREDAEARRDS